MKSHSFIYTFVHSYYKHALREKIYVWDLYLLTVMHSAVECCAGDGIKVLWECWFEGPGLWTPREGVLPSLINSGTEFPPTSKVSFEPIRQWFNLMYTWITWECRLWSPRSGMGAGLTAAGAGTILCGLPETVTWPEWFFFFFGGARTQDSLTISLVQAGLSRGHRQRNKTGRGGRPGNGWGSLDSACFQPCEGGRERGGARRGGRWRAGCFTKLEGLCLVFLSFLAPQLPKPFLDRKKRLEMWM